MENHEELHLLGKYPQIFAGNKFENLLRFKYHRFNKREEAQEAIAALNNVIPEGSNQPLTVRVADEHGKAKASQVFVGGMGMGMGPQTPMGMNMGMNNMSNMNSMNNMNMMNAMNYNGMQGGGNSHVMHRGRSRFRTQNMNPY